jgi:hypothetical protein
VRLAELAGQMGTGQPGLLSGLRNRFGVTVDEGVDGSPDLLCDALRLAGLSAVVAGAGRVVVSSSMAPGLERP